MEFKMRASFKHLLAIITTGVIFLPSAATAIDCLAVNAALLTLTKHTQIADYVRNHSECGILVGDEVVLLPGETPGRGIILMAAHQGHIIASLGHVSSEHAMQTLTELLGVADDDARLMLHDGDVLVLRSWRTHIAWALAVSRNGKGSAATTFLVVAPEERASEVAAPVSAAEVNTALAQLERTLPEQDILPELRSLISTSLGELELFHDKKLLDPGSLAHVAQADDALLPYSLGMSREQALETLYVQAPGAKLQAKSNAGGSHATLAYAARFNGLSVDRLTLNFPKNNVLTGVVVVLEAAGGKLNASPWQASLREQFGEPAQVLCTNGVVDRSCTHS